MKFDVEKVRKDFPILSVKVNDHNLIYFDNAATTQKPECVIDAESNYYKNFNSNVHRGVHKLSQIATSEYEKSHEVVASFIGANPNEIVFTSGTTESINQIAYMLIEKLIEEKGHENLKKYNIVTSEVEHHSNFLIWQEICKKYEMEFRVIPMNNDYSINIDQAKKMIDENTYIVASSHMSNLTGTIIPIKELIQLTKEKKCYSVIDGAQFIAHSKLNVKELDADFYAFSAHKLYGPTGLGFYYAKTEILNNLKPHYFGGGIVNKVDLNGHELISNNFKFESGTPKIAQAVAMIEAIIYLEKIGLENIEKYELELTKYCLEKIKKINGIKVIGSNTINSRSSLISFTVENIDAFDIGEYLNQYGIALRTGMHCAQPLLNKINIAGTIRISLSFYNTKEEIDFFLEKLEKGIELFNK